MFIGTKDYEVMLIGERDITYVRIVIFVLSLGNRRTKENTKLPDGHPRPQQPRPMHRVAALAQRDSVNSSWAPSCD